jgi:glyoxylase-like metal-dependent hydrolase (beta-lactamase superfamily II)
MKPGEVVEIRPLVRRILCDNPSVFTGPGTNTYLVGRRGGDIAVIDPGPEDEAHLDRVAEAGDGHIKWILVTHTHTDHSPGAAGLRERTGAEVIGFDERDGFIPDRRAGDGFRLGATDFDLSGIHTPGHASNHLCYMLDEERVLFSGDHIMSGSTVVIGPPDGDMAAYLDALRRLRDIDMALIAPGHGDRIDDPHAKVEEYLTHRLAREAAILSALADAGASVRIPEVVEAVYVDVPEHLHPIARHSVWAHLRKLHGEGVVTAPDVDDIEGSWSLVPSKEPGSNQ